VSLLRRAIVLRHRWLGLAGAVLFVAWFVSGIAMIYARMPRLTPEERLLRSAPLDVRAVGVSVGDAARQVPGGLERVRIGMLGERPVYRFHDGVRWSTVFADSGERLGVFDASRALEIARAFAPEHASTVRYDARLDDADQWTLQIRALLPAHRVSLGDREGSSLYISEQTAEPVLVTTRRTRAWGYTSAVVHWIYFTPIRRNGTAWSNVVIWTSVAGCVIVLTGLAWGVWQLFRSRGTPYTGLMRWHHCSGLALGVVTFTFVFSGLLSMNPWGLGAGTGPTRAQREAMSGGPLAPEPLTPGRLQAVAAALGADFPVREIELLQFRGELVAQAYRAPASRDELRRYLGDPGAVIASRVALAHRLVRVSSPEAGTFTRFDDATVLSAARAAMPDVSVQDEMSLSTYDAYYYDRQGQLPLPILRVRFNDPHRTWLYLDPSRGTIARKEQRGTRLHRWIYHGFHSLDFAWLYQRRPLWDIVVIALSLGGLFVSISSAPAG
jgi:hypothetical protein